MIFTLDEFGDKWLCMLTYFILMGDFNDYNIEHTYVCTYTCSENNKSTDKACFSKTVDQLFKHGIKYVFK